MSQCCIIRLLGDYQVIDTISSCHLQLHMHSTGIYQQRTFPFHMPTIAYDQYVMLDR
jgi:hypothetical protein